MSVTTRVVKNSSLLMVTSVVTNLMMFLLTLFTARYLGTYNFGLISSALSVIGIFGVFCDLGLGMYAIQKVSRDHDLTARYFGTAFVLRFILTILTFVFYVLFTVYSGFTGESFWVMVVIGGYMFFNSLTTFYYSMYQSNEQMHFQTIVNTVYSVGVFIVALIFIYLGCNVVWIAAAYPISMFIAFLIGHIIKIKYYPKFTYDFNKSFIRELVVNGIPFGITGVFTSIYFWIASVMLTFMSGNVAVGLFSSSQKLLLVLSSIFMLISNAVFPVMSQLYVTDTVKLNALYQKMLKYLLMLSIPIAVGSAIYSTDIIRIIFGDAFLDASIGLSVLVWAVIFMFLSGTTSTLLGAINKQFLVTKVTMGGAIVSVVANIFLIPLFSYVGASITAVLTEFVVLVLMLYALRKTDFRLNIRKTIVPIIRVLLSNMIMAMVLVYLHLPFVLGVIVAVVVYVIALFVTGAFNGEDRDIIVGLIEQVRNRG